MASWYSNLVTKTTSQISNLRSTLLSGDADGETEDDTHVCRVLRGYYSEKGRPLPSWLPADPKAVAAPPPQPMLVNQAGARYGAGGMQPQPAGGGLSSLWDTNNGAQAQQQPPQSLRAGGRAPASLTPGGIDRRPLPSQRPGSYTNTGRSETSSVPPQQAAAGGGGGGGGNTAQDRLRQRLWGGSRTTSPSQQGGSGPFQPPAAAAAAAAGGGGGGNYEDRFAPGGMYEQNGGGGNGGLRRGLPSGPRGYR